MSLHQLGWTPERASSFASFEMENLVPARVARHDRGGFVVWGAHGQLRAVIAGRLRLEDPDIAVGDWVAVDDRQDTAVIQAVLPRTSTFARKRAGAVTARQTVAANVDRLLVVCGLDGDFNPRRIERYLTLAYNSGAAPVIVLNKADVCVDVAGRVAEIESVALGVPIHALSARALEPGHDLAVYLQPGKTLAAIGSSGVGKSTLINALLGEQRLRTDRVRAGDDRGRHTTTHRELFVLPDGGVIIDTPGMRELQLWTDETGVDGAFTDIDDLASNCRFADCTHVHEPGCAVLAAASTGELDADRLSNYHKMLREVRHLEARQNVRMRLEDKARHKALHREIRRIHKRR